MGNIENTEKVESPVVEQAPQQDVSQQTADLSVPKDESAAPEAGKEAAPAYTPNLKYKSLDKEYEFDPMFKDIVKTAEAEKKIRELHEKSAGLEFTKDRYQKTKGEYEEYRSKVDPIIQSLTKADRYLENNDLNNFFKMFDINDDKVLQYALSIAKYKELSPEQRAYIDAQNAQKQRAYELEDENLTYKQRWEQSQIENLKIQFDIAMSKPEISQASAMFDQRMGQDGSFQREVATRGDYLYKTTGKIVSPEQIAQDIIKAYGLYNQQNLAPVATPQAAGNVSSTAPAQQKPTIPNLQAQSSSVVKNKVKSLDDLKKLRDQAGNNEIAQQSF